MAHAAIKKEGFKWLVILAPYFVVSFYFLLVRDFRYLIDPDTSSYISIAQKYLAGDFAAAINGQWSPLTSWLIVPLLGLQVDPMFALQLTAILCGGLALAGACLLMQSIGVSERTRPYYGMAMSPVIAYYALTQGNPDVLSLCALVFYLWIMIRADFRTSKMSGAIAGSAGAVAFLAKSYNFYFFLLHFVFFVFLYRDGTSDNRQRRIVLINGVSGLLVFLLLCAPWIGLLSSKYGHFTITTAGAYNFSYDRPGSPGHMPDTDGLMPPTNESAFSAWEDPTYIDKVPWSPLQSPADFIYFLKNIAGNSAKHALYLSRNPVFFFTIVYFFVILLPPGRDRLHRMTTYLFLTTLLHPVGFLMLHVEERYLYINFILLYVLGAYLVDKVSRWPDLPAIRKAAVSAIVCGYIATMPIAGLYYWIDKRVAPDKSIFLLSNEIGEYRDFSHARVASQVENWRDDVALFYYLNARYYGKVQPDISNEELESELLRYNIDYYFVHGELRNRIDILKPLKKIDDITIYRVLSAEET